MQLLLICFILLIEICLVGFLFFLFFSELRSTLAGAPYVPMARRYVKELLSFGGVSSHDVFCDLGCGDGRIIITAARDCHVARAIGYDVSWWPYFKATFLVKRAGFRDRIKLFRRNALTADLKNATFVYMYLYPKLVNRLTLHLAKELKPGSKVLSASFPIDLSQHQQFRLLKTEKIGTITAYLYERL